MHPLGVVTRDTVIYLVCTMWSFTDVRQLALHRMQSATMLNEACNRPEGFSVHCGGRVRLSGEQRDDSH
ncbi:WYL domain-containing protein [Massilia sp. CFBP9012]|uniref:WYL domain-containing protein n=1 Tax=Massilia sp. CFBP9012 TaxID=3096531 RepID=UPI0039C8F88B